MPTSRNSPQKSSSNQVNSRQISLPFEESVPDVESTLTRAERHAAIIPSGNSLPSVLQHAIAFNTPEGTPDLSGKLVVIIDAHSLIYQVFHALPPMTSSGGLSVAAVYGFVGDIFELIVKKQPDYLIAAFDKGDVTFRNDLYEKYKANRESMPDELRQQIPLIRQAIDALGVGIIEREGFEADDLLATVAKQVETAGGRCLIVTSDKDCRQLITDAVHLYNIRKNVELDRDFLLQDWGIRPDQVVDYQSLVGDPVDNVPGVPLIGPKLAQGLLSQFDTLEGVFENLDSVSGAKRKQNLLEGKDLAFLSRQLVRLRDDVPCDIPWSRSTRNAANLHRILALFEEFGFRRYKERAIEVFPTTVGARTESAWITNYETIVSEEQLHQWVARVRNQSQLSIDTETTGTDARSCKLVGISIAWDVGEAVYIPIRSPEHEPKLNQSTVIDALRPLFESTLIRKIGQNLKFDIVVLRSAGLHVAGVTDDTMVADYLVNPGSRTHNLDELAKRFLQHTNVPITDLIGSGKNQRSMSDVPLDKISYYACEDVDVPIRLLPLLTQAIETRGLTSLYKQVEVPIIDVLAEMEYNGIRVDADYLSQMSHTFSYDIEQMRDQIFEMAGETFNLDSPKQLAEVLFQRLKLPVIRKTKTGLSTDADVLGELAFLHPLPAKIIEYRQATKLKNTYIDALPQLICPTTKRIHTSFRQDVAATGRLSSTDPNLQNIPIRTEQGRAIRRAFTAGEPAWVLLGADYSQIELRVLAHFSRDPALLAAYREDADIHSRVAAEVHGIPESEITSEMRRIAKTINFGIVYGQSPFGLAKTLGISKEKARDYIEMYFTRYAGVQDFMLKTLSECRSNGYVSTMLGRRREIQGVRDLSKLEPSKRRNLTDVERMAINMPIQGSAADLIKLAMLATHRRLRESGLQAKLLLQIHDELLFETPESEAPALAKLVREAMSTVMELSVPLKVDVSIGATWADALPFI
jgi:DNA polymerase-1